MSLVALLLAVGFFGFCGVWIWATLAEPDAFRSGAKFPDQEGGEA